VTPRWPIVAEVTPDEVIGLAAEERWVLGSVDDEQPGSPFQIAWTTADGATTLRYVEDTVLGVRYIVASGPSDAIAGRLHERGVTYSAADVTEMSERARTPQQRLAVTSYAGAAAGDTPDAGLLRTLESALEDSEPEIRRVGVMASAYAGWPELLPRLEQIAREDPDAEARKLAARVAASLQAPSHEEPSP
jgi:hypothetical protein